MLLSQKHTSVGFKGLLVLGGLLILGGCRDNPGTWGAEKVTTKIAASTASTASAENVSVWVKAAA